MLGALAAPSSRLHRHQQSQQQEGQPGPSLGPLARRLLAVFAQVQQKQQPPMENDGPDDECCRICRDGGSREALNGSPCECRGSVSPVHRSCLESWLSRTNSSRCELCGQRYEVVRTPRHGVVRSFVRWLTLPPDEGPGPSLGPEAAAMFSMAPLAAFGAAALLASASAAAAEGPSGPSAPAVALCCGPALVAAALDLAIVASFLARLPAYYASWRRHRAADNTITVLFPGDEHQSDAAAEAAMATETTQSGS